MNYKSVMLAYESLADEESRKWFNARIDYAINSNKYLWWKNIYDCGKSWQFYGADIDCISEKRYEGKKIVIFGAGKYGQHAFFILSRSILADRVHSFIDNDLSLQGGEICGCSIRAPKDILKAPDDYLVIVGSDKHSVNMYRQLCFMGFPQTNIYMPKEGRFVGLRGHQYFDLFEPENNEIFIDAGCFDGSTSCDFVDWCDNNYKKIYAFEPTPDMAAICRKKISNKGIRDFDLQEKVCWSKKARVTFEVSSIRSASSVRSDVGGTEAVSIDDVLHGTRASFIKMDVEGSEMEALKGAQATIKKYKPKLAISLYHKQEDIFKIPAYIVELNREYKLYIRHYTSDIWETVLYAV